MSIENSLKSIATSLEAMNTKLELLAQGQSAPVVNTVQGSLNPIPTHGMQVPGSAASPDLTQPDLTHPNLAQLNGAQVTPITCPFTDAKGLIDYVMAAYKELGQTKGAGIQQVMAGLGITNINDTKPEQYQALFDGIQALKVAG